MTSASNIRELARNDGFNEYFRKQFNGNEATYLRLKEVFDVLEIEGGKGIYYTVRESLEHQVLRITRSEDLVKLKALAKLCSKEFFNDESLLVVACRRILVVLELAMPEEKKVRGKKKKQQKKMDPRKLDILDACLTLGNACNSVGDFDCRRYVKRAKEGYEEQLGRDSEKAPKATSGLIMNGMSVDERIEKYRDLVKRMERALGEENRVTLETLSQLGIRMEDNGEYEESIIFHEKYLARRSKVLREDHKDTLNTLNNLGLVYDSLKYYEKAIEYYERALKVYERTLGKNHPDALMAVMNTVTTSLKLREIWKAEELYQRALEGYEAQLGKDHERTKRCAHNFWICLKLGGNVDRLEQLKAVYQLLGIEE
ncbi:hypothetical protein TL16_g10479 [Triparma laevis f. inornata]|uniref:Kinesin light chain n=1 Tax=Triparma laevis f. inornata TaxID=1714386 RepID=A0A9W7BEI6_9STRA|nr:hypothetical protein TL16_g10479 [Triparma laevis f. inornata]